MLLLGYPLILIPNELNDLFYTAFLAVLLVDNMAVLSFEEVFNNSLDPLAERPAISISVGLIVTPKNL